MHQYEPHKGLLKNAKIRKVLVAVQGLEPRTRGLVIHYPLNGRVEAFSGKDQNPKT